MAFLGDCFPPGVRSRFGGPHEAISDDEVVRIRKKIPTTLETHYDDYALSSYATFCKLRAERIILPNVRFQVCLPTPIIVIAGHIHPAFHGAVEPVYEVAILRALLRIQAEIPAHDLAIQWDMPGKIAFLEQVLLTPWFAPVKQGIADRLVRLAAAVSDGVELGFHLCYGDSGHQHFVEPKGHGNLGRNGKCCS